MLKKKLWLRMVLFIMVVGLVLSGCNKYNQESSGPAKSDGKGSANNTQAADKPKDPTVFNFATNQDIPHIDPAGTAANTSFRVQYMMYDRLVTYNGTTT